jgi:cytochrome b
MSFIPLIHWVLTANTWIKTDAVIDGRRWDVLVGYDSVAKRILRLSGRTS